MKLGNGEVALILLVGMVSALLIILYPVSKPTEIQNVSDYLLDFSALFSALSSAYLLHWTSQKRSTIDKLLKNARNISYKITDFKRICYVLANDRNIWNTDIYDKISYNQFRDLKYSELYQDHNILKTDRIELVNSFCNDDEGRTVSSGQALLLLALRELAELDDSLYIDYKLYNNYDENILYRPSMIAEWLRYSIPNTLWYWLTNKGYLQHMEANMIDTSKERLNILIHKIGINQFFELTVVPRNIGNIGSYFESKLLRDYVEIMNAVKVEQSSKVPNILLVVTIFILTLGAVIPLLFSSLAIHILSFRNIILGCLWVTLLCLIYFILLLSIITEETTTVIRDEFLSE